MRPLLNLIISVGFFVGATSSAAVITFVGENTTNAQSWRTSSVSKAINPANNNIYGNDGYVMFTTTSTISTLNQGSSGVNPFTFSTTVSGFTLKTLEVTPTYVSSFTPASTFNEVFTSTSYLPMDNPAGGSMRSGVAFQPGSGPNTFVPYFNFMVNSSVPSSFVLGLFFNNGAGFVGHAEITGGGATTPGTITVFNNIDAIFFRITGATSGTVFTVLGETSTAVGANGNLDLTGITFDSVPEPTTLGGCAITALAFIWFGRRRKNPRSQITARLLDRDGLS